MKNSQIIRAFQKLTDPEAAKSGHGLAAATFAVVYTVHYNYKMSFAGYLIDKFLGIRGEGKKHFYERI